MKLLSRDDILQSADNEGPSLTEVCDNPEKHPKLMREMSRIMNEAREHRDDALSVLAAVASVAAGRHVQGPEAVDVAAAALGVPMSKLLRMTPRGVWKLCQSFLASRTVGKPRASEKPRKTIKSEALDWIAQQREQGEDWKTIAQRYEKLRRKRGWPKKSCDNLRQWWSRNSSAVKR